MYVNFHITCCRGGVQLKFTVAIKYRFYPLLVYFCTSSIGIHILIAEYSWFPQNVCILQSWREKYYYLHFLKHTHRNTRFLNDVLRIICTDWKFHISSLKTKPKKLQNSVLHRLKYILCRHNKISFHPALDS